MYAVIDPNWGEPRVVPQTIRDTAEEAVNVALLDESMSLYSGAVLMCTPKSPGSWERLQAHGFKLAQVAVEIKETVQ